MTRPDLDAIRARCDAATQGPWSVSTLTFPNGNTVVESIAGVSEPQWSDYGDGDGEWFTDRLTLVETDAGHYGPTMPDAQFIAAARTDVPALLAYIDELENRTSYTVGETEWSHRIAVAEQRFADEYDAHQETRTLLTDLWRKQAASDAAQMREYGISYDGVRRLITDYLDDELSLGKVVELLRAAAREIAAEEVAELKARITTLEVMR